VASSRVDGLSDGLPASDLLRRPETRGVRKAGVSRGDECRFRNEEGAWDTSTLSVILNCQRHLDMVVVCADTSKRCHCDAMSKVHGAHA